MNTQDVVVATVKATPPATVVICNFFLNIDNDIKILTLIYILVQIAYLIWKWRKEKKAGDI